MDKSRKKIVLLLILLFPCFISISGFRVMRKFEYVLIDSITEIKGVYLPVLMHGTRFERYVQTQLTAGYSYIPQMKDIQSRTNHAFEIGLARSKVIRYIESASTCFYLSNEFLFNKDQLSIGPKIGINAFVWGFGIGTEFVYYTDFKDNTLHWVSYLGIGLGAANLRMGLHVPFYNSHFQDISRVSLSLTLPFCTLYRKNIVK